MTDFAATKAMFHLPMGIIYLDGNSLGPLPKAASARLSEMLRDEWGEMLIKGWNGAGWYAQPMTLGDRVARLIGAEPGHVVIGETLSIKVYQALAAALNMRDDRRVVLSDTGNFPTDLYMAEGLIKTLDKGHDLRLVAPEQIESAITDDVAVVMITEVDYRTGRKHDMASLTRKAHEVGALIIWDLAHTAGAVPVDVAGAGADFAVGCTYKYLNGGPGAPAFIYVAPRHADKMEPALSGWQGHTAPFLFDLGYRPASGAERFRIGTPPVIQMTALETAMDIWELVDMDDLRAQSIKLTDLFITEVERTCPMLQLVSPRDSSQRGSQVSFNFTEGYAAMQALIARGVIGDYREPGIMRFGFAPLYIDEADVRAAVKTISQVMNEKLWDRDEYKVRSKVT